MNKHFLIFLVFLTFLAAAVPVFGQTAVDKNTGILSWTDEGSREIVFDPDNYGLAEDPDFIHPGFIPSGSEEKSPLPGRYDSREHGNVTPVKNQQHYDLCWAMSVMSAAESDLISKKLVRKSIDLSEIFPHYFQWHRVSDPLGLTGKDQNLWHAYESSRGKVREWINSWSSGYRAVMLLSSWIGVVPESTAPYPAEDADITHYSIDPSLAWDSAIAHLENAYWISMEDTDAIKQMIMKHGSVVMVFNQNRSKYLNEETGAYYCPDQRKTNHLINVVGWDDNYDRSNFLDHPGRNGAWLVKNSFGTEWGNDGFFWLSYEDKTIFGEAFVFDFSLTDPQLRNYQYDGTVSYSYLNDPSAKSFTAANVFTSQNNEKLTAVAFATPSTGFDYDIKIYRGTDGTSPETGTVCSHQKGRKLYAGFHTIVLDKPVKLAKGERFSVVVEITADKSGEAYLLTDRSVSYTVVPAGSRKKIVFSELISFSQPGESWYRTSGGKWVDCWNADSKKSLGNVRIKAITRLDSIVSSKDAALADMQKSVPQYESKHEEGFTLYRIEPVEPVIPNFTK